MAYTPRKKKFKLRYKVAIPCLVLLLCVAYFFFNISNKEEKKKEIFKVCGFSNDKTLNTLSKSYDDVIEMQDYTFYGESLGIYSTPYTGETDLNTSGDSITGKTVILKDVCNGKEYANVIDTGVDQKIKLGDIEPGFYEVYVVENLKNKRLVSSDPIDTSIKTLTKDGKNNNVRLYSNVDLLKDYDKKLDKQYVFLEVSETTLAKDEYDVVIDPAGNDKDFTYEASKGSEGNGIVEASETYKAAEKLKTDLEKNGLKVLILRNEDEVINTYGTDGKLARAYASKAKLYVYLGFYESKESPNYSGMEVAYSGHSNKMLADRIMFDLTKDVGVSGSTVYMGPGDSRPGVVESSMYASTLDGRTVYDSNMQIREAGGKATQAGMYSQNAIDGNASFAKDNVFGMQTISIHLGYVTNTNDVNIWNEKQDAIITSISNSILSYTKVKVE